MRPWPAAARAPIGPAGSLQRKLTVNILLALFAVVAISATVLIYEFFEHLDESLDGSLAREAKEVLTQADPARPGYGLDPMSLRFRGAGGAYRYTLFGPDLQPVAGSEDSAAIRDKLGGLPLGTAEPVDLPGARRGMGLCGMSEGQRLCALASADAPRTDTNILKKIWYELEEQVHWVLLGSTLILASALLAARISLRPLGRVLREAQDIGPEAPKQRLTAKGLPSEIVPLVEAVNSAFGRLETGYRAQREFSANVAHEVRTPLAVLHSSVDTVQDDPLRRRLKQDLARIETIFEQLIDLARAEALEPASFGPVDLRALAAQVSSERASDAIRARRSLAVTGAQSVSVHGNAGLLSIALDNLVRNALAYAPPESEVEIRVQASPPGLKVLDRGPGIAPADQAALFQRFTRGGGTKGEGSGLGLAIVKSVAEAHGATVSVIGRAAGGSAFVLEFPDNAATDGNPPGGPSANIKEHLR
jgi:signal transduction histidine kinase